MTTGRPHSTILHNCDYEQLPQLSAPVSEFGLDFTNSLPRARLRTSWNSLYNFIIPFLIPSMKVISCSHGPFPGQEESEWQEELGARMCSWERYCYVLSENTDSSPICTSLASSPYASGYTLAAESRGKSCLGLDGLHVGVTLAVKVMLFKARNAHGSIALL
jgi:hypothetical protein